MEALWTMGRNVLLFVALAVPGYLLRKTNKLEKNASKILSKVILLVAMPFLVGKGLMTVTLTASLFIEMAIAGALYIVLILACLYGGKAFAAKGLKQKEITQGITAAAMTFANNGFLGIPLVAAVFPDNPTIMMFAVVFNIINQTILYTLGESMVSGAKAKNAFVKMITHPAVIATAIGILFNILKVPTYVPEVLQYSTYLSNLVVPLSMFVLGINLAGIQMKDIFTSPQGYLIVAFRLVIAPVVALGLAFLIRLVYPLSDDLMISFFIANSMPVAAMVTTFAEEYNKDTKMAVTYTMLSAILSVITIPVLYYLLRLILSF